MRSALIVAGPSCTVSGAATGVGKQALVNQSEIFRTGLAPPVHGRIESGCSAPRTALRGGLFLAGDESDGVFVNESNEHAAELVQQADAIVIAAGAGIGVDSGLPDFRGNDGFWKAYPALASAGMNFAEVASPRTFARDPRLAWGFYGHRLALYRATVPHDGFTILKRWAERASLGAFVFTSNVDGQFQRAGFGEDRIHECHGSIHHVQCLTPCGGDIWPADSRAPSIDLNACRWLGNLPTCSLCGRLLRPNILMFGDGAWLEWRAEQQRLRLHAWLSQARWPVVVELGAGTHIPSVRYFGNEVVHRHGGRLIRINPREADVPTRLDVGIRAGALEGLRAIDVSLANGA